MPACCSALTTAGASSLMASLIEYCEGGADHDAEPLRYPLEHVGHVFDAASVSRLMVWAPPSL